MAPQPSLVYAEPDSAFGFRIPMLESISEVRMSDHGAIGRSMQPAEVALNPESDFEQAAQNDKHQNIMAMDVSPEVYGVDLEEHGGGMNPGTSVNENIIHKSFLCYGLVIVVALSHSSLT